MKNINSKFIKAFITIIIMNLVGCEKVPEDSKQVNSEATQPADTEDPVLKEMKKNGATPDFKKILVNGATGSGVIAKYLKNDGRDLNGTADSHDSQLIDSSAMTGEAAIAAIKEALEKKLPIIIDGGDSSESSAGLKKVMDESVGFSIDGVVAYVISFTGDGKKMVVPLESISNSEGVKAIDQTKNYFQRNINIVE